LTPLAIDATGRRVYMPAYDDDPHQSASPPRSRGMRACLKNSHAAGRVPRRISDKIRRVIVRSYKTTEI